jgi:uncharacterized protein Yka (UPF0111/DUF47 family)
MNLLPRDDKFFKYFQQQVKLICQAADLPVEGAAAGNAHLANAAHQIHVLEEQADSVLHEIYTRLNSTFITPLDPEDIQSLSSHLDDVIDGIEDSVHRMRASERSIMNQTGHGACRWCGATSGMGACSGRIARGSWAFSNVLQVLATESSLNGLTV